MNLAVEIEITKYEGGSLYSNMGGPERIYAVQHVRRMRGGSQAHVLRASDNYFYVVKFQNNPQDIRILVNEYLATRLAALLGLSVPEVAIIDVPEWLIQNSPELKIDIGGGLLRPCASGPQFGSRYVADPHTTAVFDYLPGSILKQIANINDFPQVLAFDKWTGNADGRQAVFAKQPNQRRYKAWFIDQGYCLNAGEWSFPDSPLRGVFARNAVYEHVTGWNAFEPTLSRIEAITEDAISGIASEIPPEWFRHDSNALSRLIATLHQRRLSVRNLITAFRNSSRSPFPNWTEREEPSTNSQTNNKEDKQTQMNDSALKLVLIFNSEAQGYKCAAHNLTATQAVEQFGSNSAAKIIDQGRQHRSSDVRRCRSCNKAALDATREHNESARQREPEQEQLGAP